MNSIQDNTRQPARQVKRSACGYSYDSVRRRTEARMPVPVRRDSDDGYVELKSIFVSGNVRVARTQSTRAVSLYHFVLYSKSVEFE